METLDLEKPWMEKPWICRNPRIGITMEQIHFHRLFQSVGFYNLGITRSQRTLWDGRAHAAARWRPRCLPQQQHIVYHSDYKSFPRIDPIKWSGSNCQSFTGDCPLFPGTGPLLPRNCELFPGTLSMIRRRIVSLSRADVPQTPENAFPASRARVGSKEAYPRRTSGTMIQYSPGTDPLMYSNLQSIMRNCTLFHGKWLNVPKKL